VELDFLKWIEHAGFLLEIKGKNVYIDPFKVNAKLPKADLIFITHSHFDHFDVKSIAILSTENTYFIAPKEVASKLSGRKVLEVVPGRSYEAEGVCFSTVPAYNANGEFHPKEAGSVGYIIDANGVRVYHAGDTDFIEEMKHIDVDVALIPMGGTYTMDVEDAIRAAGAIKAKVVIPMHYRALLGKEGSAKAEEEFMKSVKNGLILDQVQDPCYSP